MEKEKDFLNTSWNFNLDTIHNYAFSKNAFTPEECEKIINIANNKRYVTGITSGNIPDIRESEISWLYVNDDLEWLYRRLTDIILDLNNKYFNFDIFGLSEGLQFTNYKAPSGRYGKHMDRGYKSVVRKLSISIQLTDPKKYKGGELFLYDNEIGEQLTKDQGTLVMFPSFMLHEVKPVTEGERNSLVAWVTGNQFR